MVPLETLKNVRFLHDIGDDHLQHLASLAEVREVPADTVIFREGQYFPSVSLVLEGVVSLEIQVPGRGGVRVYTISAGEELGWSPVLQAGPMTATARTLAPCRLLTFSAPQVLALCAHDPALGLEFMRRTALALAQRLNATRLQLLDVYQHELPAIPDEGGHA